MFEGVDQTRERHRLLDGVRLRRAGAALLDDLSLDVSAEGVTALMGPNGAGKSLALRVLAGLVRADAGAVTPPDGGTALVFQKPVLLRRSVRANLAHALRAYGAPPSERAARLDELLEEGQLAYLTDRPARALSGGEQQRVAMMRALAVAPTLLLLDEPTASLDPQATAAIEALIGRAAAQGAKVILVTHDRGQTQRLAGEVAFMHRGRITESRATVDFFASPASEPARAYLDGRLLV